MFDTIKWVIIGIYTVIIENKIDIIKLIWLNAIGVWVIIILVKLIIQYY